VQGNTPIFGTACFLHSVCAWAALQVFHRESSFIAKVRNRRITLGAYPTVALHDARQKGALALKADNAPGQRALPFAEARTAFPEFKKKHLRPPSHQEMIRNITKHFTWSKALAKITTDVASAIEKIEAPPGADHAFKDVRTCFSCVPRHLKYSPCTGLKVPNKAPTRSRLLTDDELKAVWRAAGQAEGHLGSIVKMLILTGQRRGEIAALRAGWM
jgi:integrase